MGVYYILFLTCNIEMHSIPKRESRSFTVIILNDDEADAVLGVDILGRFIESKLMGPVSLTENKETSFGIVLKSKPKADVDIIGSVEGGEDTKLRAGFTPMKLHFGAENWNDPQKISVSAEDDNIDDVKDNATFVVTYHAASEDTEYQNLRANCTIIVVVNDDDTAGVSLFEDDSELSSTIVIPVATVDRDLPVSYSTRTGTGTY